MTRDEAKELVEWAKDQGIKRMVCGPLEVEFFGPKITPMSLDPKDLAKVFTDSMPPDTAMLFASTEGVPDENPTPEQREDDKMI